VPSARQYGQLAATWAAVAWGTTVAWSITAQDPVIAHALESYYTWRAPLVGAVAGVLWAPVLCAAWLPRRAGLFAFKRTGPIGQRRAFTGVHLLQGSLVGQLVGAFATVLLLLAWPNDLQNTRVDAFKWAAFTWKLYWFLFVPAAATAGILSAWVAVSATSEEDGDTIR
jgi:hypothetical protein